MSLLSKKDLAIRVVNKLVAFTVNYISNILIVLADLYNGTSAS